MDLSFKLQGRQVKIFVDGELFKEVSVTLFGKNPSLPKYLQDIDSLKTFLAEEEYQKGRSYALKCLGNRNYLASQLKEALINKLVDPSIADRILSDCKRYGYLDDDAFIDGYIRQCLSRHDGPQKIIMKLREKGVSYTLASEKVAAFADSETEQIQYLLKTRYSRYNLEDYKERQKVIAALQRKGFSLDKVFNSLENNGLCWK